MTSAQVSANSPSTEDRWRIVREEGYVLAMVCDGHNGPAAAQFVCDTLPGKIASLGRLTRATLTQAIKGLDVEILTRAMSVNGDRLNEGTTLAMVIDTPRGVFLVSVGDSLVAVVNDQGKVIASLGIKKELPYTYNSRIDGGINIDAALGDWHLKDSRLYNHWRGSGEKSTWPSPKLHAQYAEERGIDPNPWPTPKAYKTFFGHAPDALIPLALIENTPAITMIGRRQLPPAYGLVLASDGVTDVLPSLSVPLQMMAKRDKTKHGQWLLQLALEASLAANVNDGLLKPMDLETYATLRPGEIPRKYLGVNGQRRRTPLTLRDVRDDMTTIVLWSGGSVRPDDRAPGKGRRTTS
jgi:serine/threonine protein phosphatase PrpC